MSALEAAEAKFKERAEKLAAHEVALRREAIMATLLTGWLSDMEADAARRNVAHARKVADAIMEAAK
jgi:hypothetical protein